MRKVLRTVQSEERDDRSDDGVGLLKKSREVDREVRELETIDKI